MKFQNISLYHFKNHTKQAFQFDAQYICITGPNGVGKTNILDALHYICMMKSYFNYSDRYAIQHGVDFFRIESQITDRDERTYKCVITSQKEKTKNMTINSVPVEKRLDHLGRWPIVFISPGDHRLLMYEGSKERQKFIDMCLSQVDNSYMNALSLYHNYLKQRNAILKKCRDLMSQQALLLLNTIEEQMAPHALIVYRKRKEFIRYLNTEFIKFYQLLSGKQEKMSLSYRSHLENIDENTVGKMWAETIRRDRELGYTTRGIHRDDLVIKMGGRVLRNYGSQGQVKSMVIALKLAQLSYMERELQEKPILLLDDLFEKLDDQRLDRLMQLLTSEMSGKSHILQGIQVFITDTSARRVDQLLRGHEINYTHIPLYIEDEEE